MNGDLSILCYGLSVSLGDSNIREVLKTLVSSIPFEIHIDLEMRGS